ncbi:DUF6783 domain-containing protein [Enterocloster hominis (ex Hitch et al. 2024)]
MGTKYAAKWGVQMAGMNFQTHPRSWMPFIRAAGHGCIRI